MKLEYEALLSKYHESLIKTAIDKDYFEKCIKNIVSECEHQELPSFLKAVTI